MSKIDENAQPIAFFDNLRSECGQSAKARRVGVNIAQRHGGVTVVKQPKVPQTAVIGFLHPLKVALKEVSAFDRLNDCRLLWAMHMPAGVSERFMPHDPEFEANGALTLFDNSNLRFPSGGNSRGQAWQLDETNLIATPLLNVDLGVQSVAVGAAARLSNGNYWFCAGFILPHDTQSSEVTPAGDLVFRSGVDAIVSRTFRLRSMYGE